MPATGSRSARRDKKGRRRLVFAPYKLPRDFDIRDHDARVRELGRAFVRSLTATEHALKRFGE